MIIKQRVKFQKKDVEGKMHKFTLVIAGRTNEELAGRVEKTINKYLHNGYELR